MIIVTCVAVLSIFALQFNVVRQRTSQQSNRQFLQAGERLEAIGDLRLNDSSLTLIMWLSADCKYCIQSTPFYQRLSETVKTAEPGQAQLVMVTRDTRDVVDAFIRQNNLAVAQVVTASARQQAMLRVPGTPSLILVDRARLVRKVWFGKLDSNAEQEVLSTLLENSRQRSSATGTSLAWPDNDRL